MLIGLATRMLQRLEQVYSCLLTSILSVPIVAGVLLAYQLLTTNIVPHKKSMLFYPLVSVDIDSPDALWGSLLIIRLPTTDIASELQIHAISASNCEFPYPRVCGDWYALGLTKSDSDNGRSFHQGGFANCLHASSQDLWRQFCENQIQQSHNPATTQYGKDHFQTHKRTRTYCQ